LNLGDDGMAATTHTLTIQHCNNIIDGAVSICEGQLNIKYAINGTGKSTIAQAIQLKCVGKSLSGLTPFSYLAQKVKDKKPSIAPMPFQKIMVFDVEYLKQYIYQKTDLLKDTFEVLIRTDEYNTLKEAIDQDFENIKALARDKQNVVEIKKVLDGLCQMIAITGDKKLDLRKPGVKSILEGKGALFQPPESLKEFNPFFQDENSSSWAAWKFKGIQSFGGKGLCPFCAEPETDAKKKQTQDFQESFDEPSVTYTSQLRDYLISIRDYIDGAKIEFLLSLFRGDANKSDLELALIKLRVEADHLSKKIDALVKFDGYAIDQSNMDNFETQFDEMKISLAGLDYFNTSAFTAIINPINNQIDALIVKF
jgi:hypothetical protein